MSFRNLLLFASILGTASCSTSVPMSTEESARLAFENAKNYQDSARYELALEKFNYVKNKFPFTTYAVDAELEIANTYYLQTEYTQAIAAYQSFKELHPQHSQLAFVTYIIGDSYFLAAPGSVDRDLTPIKQGIQVFEDLIRRYPRSEYIKEAKEKIKFGRGLLAEREIYIGSFNYKKSFYKAAAFRFQNVLDRFSDAGHDAEAAYLLGESYRALEEMDQAKRAYQIAISKEADSEWAHKAESRLKGLQ
ncbi:MAG TPA: outer membrane protein assembly factor BamD [Bdellovibrionota bacterium]|nr:outer membrane protein assembly factor BamD [Bdellovibrionota bacterium]